MTIHLPVSSGKISCVIQDGPLTRSPFHNRTPGNRPSPISFRPFVRRLHHQHLEISASTVLVSTKKECSVTHAQRFPRVIGVCHSGCGHRRRAVFDDGIGYTMYFLKMLSWGYAMESKAEVRFTFASGCLGILAGHIGH